MQSRAVMEVQALEAEKRQLEIVNQNLRELLKKERAYCCGHCRKVERKKKGR